jgi:hypothetical protein
MYSEANGQTGNYDEAQALTNLCLWLRSKTKPRRKFLPKGAWALRSMELPAHGYFAVELGSVRKSSWRMHLAAESYTRAHPLTLLRSRSTPFRLFLCSLFRSSSTYVGALKFPLNRLTSPCEFEGDSCGDNLLLAYP